MTDDTTDTDDAPRTGSIDLALEDTREAIEERLDEDGDRPLALFAGIADEDGLQTFLAADDGRDHEQASKACFSVLGGHIDHLAENTRRDLYTTVKFALLASDGLDDVDTKQPFGGPDSEGERARDETEADRDGDSNGEGADELGFEPQLIGRGLDHEDEAAALFALREEIDPMDPPQSIHMTIRGDDGVQNYFFVSDDIVVGPKADMLGHFANHLKEVADFLDVSPAAAGKVAADVVESWSEKE